MCFKERKKREIYAHQCPKAYHRKKHDWSVQRRCAVFNDYYKNMYTVFAFEGISSGQFWIVSYMIIVLSVYILFFRSFFQYEPTSFYDFYYYFYDGTCLRANLSDEV